MGAGVLVINSGVVMLNKDSFHDLTPIGFIVAIYYIAIPPRRGSHVKSDNTLTHTHTHNQDTPLSPYT